MAAPEQVVDFVEKLAGVDEHWAPRIVAQFNDLHLKVVKVLGEFVWHRHDDTDELFIVLAGELTIELRDRPAAQLGPGQLFVVPRGVEHRPIAVRECHVLLVEPDGTPNTGDQSPSAMTASDQWI